MAQDFLPAMPDDWEPTRASLHAYTLAAAALPRAHAAAHPSWWHASLKVTPTGLVSDPIPTPQGANLLVRLDPVNHVIAVEPSSGSTSEFDMRAGMTGSEMGDALIAAAAEHGLEGGYDRAKFESDDARTYEPDHAEVFWSALVNVDSVFQKHRSGLEGEVSPVQLWPHGFDLSFEWIGTRIERHQEGGEEKELPAQLNLGFYPAGDAYFYSNPWPFEESLTAVELPHGAVWHTEGWQGTMLPYAGLAGDPEAAEKLAEFAAAVHEAASPTLLA